VGMTGKGGHWLAQAVGYGHADTVEPEITPWYLGNGVLGLVRLSCLGRVGWGDERWEVMEKAVQGMVEECGGGVFGHFEGGLGAVVFALGEEKGRRLGIRGLEVRMLD